MQPSEYLAFIPLLIYGLALADLLGQWRRFFERDYFYLPYFLTTLIFTEVAIWNVFIYLGVTQQLAGISYFQYWLYLSQPMLFLITVAALTPETENKETEIYFKQRIPIVFGLMALYIGSHLFQDYGPGGGLNTVRVVTVALCGATAASRKVWLVYVAAGLWGISLITRAMAQGVL